ncbi:MAG: hypothetical protein J6T10_01355 [Methanobrevibacter sp.]|nr:hypothetical protein [Methanobrevibacter sp.]
MLDYIKSIADKYNVVQTSPTTFHFHYNANYIGSLLWTIDGVKWLIATDIYSFSTDNGMTIVTTGATVFNSPALLENLYNRLRDQLLESKRRLISQKLEEIDYDFS